MFLRQLRRILYKKSQVYCQMSVQLFGSNSETRLTKLENEVRMLKRQLRELKEKTKHKSSPSTVTPDKDEAVECTIT